MHNECFELTPLERWNVQRHIVSASHWNIYAILIALIRIQALAHGKSAISLALPHPTTTFFTTQQSLLGRFVINMVHY